jgi:transcriptional regulator with XRE-family HTH domain
MALSDDDLARGQRIKAVRDARGETQPEFAERLAELTKQRYDASEVSRLETGNRVATWDDIAAIASLDPEQRGRDWLGWDDDDSAEGATRKRPPRGPDGGTPALGVRAGEKLQGRRPPLQTPKDAPRTRRDKSG